MPFILSVFTLIQYLHSNRTTIEDQKAEILRLHNVLDSKEEMEKKQSGQPNHSVKWCL